jgi:50S ribosomal subunit-associated GTPase HflX
VRVGDRRELLLSDTVGFIDRLPHALVAAFRATLEEVAQADLLLHVVDAAAGGVERRMAAVRRVLEEVHATFVPVLEVMNKCDVLDEAERRRIQHMWPDAWLVSAATGEGCAALLDGACARLGLDTRRVATGSAWDSCTAMPRSSATWRTRTGSRSRRIFPSACSAASYPTKRVRREGR